MTPHGWRLVGVAALCLAVSATGCAWQTYAVTRTIRHVTGARSRVHLIVPVALSLRDFRVIEVRSLTNLLPGRVPPSTERYLNDRIATELGGLTSSPAIVRPSSDPVAAADGPGTAPPSARTLIVDGFLDDFDGGSLPLRIVELGFNHIAVTVRVRLRDRESQRIVGAASVTAEDDRESGTTTAAINRVAQRIGEFVETGYVR